MVVCIFNCIFNRCILIVGYYLPPYHICSLKHLQRIGTKQALALKTEDVLTCNPPNFPELSVEKIYTIFE